MPDATITSTASTFGTISGTFAADQSTVTGTVTGLITGTLTGSVGVPGPAGPAGAGVPAGGTAGQYLQKIDGVDYNTDWVTLNLSAYAPINSPVFTGDPQAPTPAFGDNDTSIATTAFVQAGLLGGTANARNLEVYVRNQSGSTIPAGAIVYISGATGNRPLITLAQANNDANSAQTMGFTKTSIANNGFGYVIVRGELENIDTSALTEGAQLYLSPTTPGAWTTTKPSAPQHLVYVGIVVRAHPNQGVILVAVQNGYELDELHTVSLTSPANNDLLTYESSSSLWKNKSFSTLGLATQSWVTAGFYPLTGNPSGFLTSASLTPYLTKADNLGSLTNFTTARDNLGIGTANTPVFAGLTVQGSGANVANLTPTSLTLTHATSGSFVIQPSQGIVFPDATIQTTAFTASALSGYAPLAGATFTGKVNFKAGTTSSASVNLAPGVAPTSPSTGDIWFDSSSSKVVFRSSALTQPIASEFWVTSQSYVDASALSAALGPYLTSADAATTYYPLSNPAGYIDASALAGYATESWVTAGFYPLTGNPSGFITSSALTGYATESWVYALGYLTDAPIDGNQYVRLNGAWSTLSVPADYITSVSSPLSVTAGDLSIDLSAYAPKASPALTGNVTITSNSTGAALFIEQAGTGNILTLHDQASDTNFVAIDQNGKVNTIASTTTNAGFNVPHGTAPTSPVNGDVWTTTSGLFTRINGGTQQYAPLGSNNTFSNASSTYGSSTATGTIGVATGATISGSTKTVNIGTGGVSGSTTNVNIANNIGGPSGVSTINIGTSTPASTVNLNGTVNAATATAGTSTTQIATTAFVTTADNLKANLASPTFTGTPLSTTAAADTNTTQIATTAFVVGQAGSATPLMDNGTAAVGTSLRYARQDHVHPTDTSRAALASPTFTGTPAAPTAAVDTNTTQVATTAFVVGQGYAKLASPALTGTPTAPTASAGTNTTQVATTAFVTSAIPSFATASQSRTATSTTVTQNPSTNLWQTMNPGFIPIVRSALAYTATGTMGAAAIGTYTSRMTMGTAGAASGNFRTFGSSQIDQAWICVSKGYRSYIDFSRVTWCSGRFYTDDTLTDPQVTVAFYFGKANNSANGDLARAGFGWKLSGNATASLRNPVLQVHNGTTLTNVTTSFALVAQQYFDWDIVSLGNGTVTLYINGTQYATTSLGPTGDTSYSGTSPVIWNEEIKSTGTTAGYNATFSRGLLYIAP